MIRVVSGSWTLRVAVQTCSDMCHVLSTAADQRAATAAAIGVFVITQTRTGGCGNVTHVVLNEMVTMVLFIAAVHLISSRSQDVYIYFLIVAL